MPRAPKSVHSESVKVVLRCRPLNNKEITSRYEKILEIDSKRGQITLRNPKKKDEEPREYTFDAVYDSNSTQVELYDETFRPLVDSVLQGFNGTIFAYGQTGTGKTYTMEGVRDDPELRGIIPRSFDHIFGHIEQSENCQYLVRASYLEIYQEEIRDLLHKDQHQRLELKERPDTGTYVKDLSSFVCKSVKEIEHVMSVGNSNRSVGATNMNEHSSRSHAIFLVTVECSERGADGEDHIRVGKLNMVDLAGSERQAKTGATGERLKEATKINLSLSALGNIISALVDGKSSHIPYRDSKLTRLFQDSLGGNAKTVMVANIGPASYNYDETLSTLRYANRAKNIKNKPKINEDPKDALLREFQSEIEKLKAQLRSRAGGGEKWRRRRARHGTGTGGTDGAGSEHELTPEEVLEQERARLEMERSAIENDQSLIAEERERLLAELHRKDEQLEREHQAHERLADKIQAMESKLLSGAGRTIADTTNQQQRELELSRQRIAEQKAREREMLQRLEEQEGSRLDIQQTFQSLQQEVDVKTKKLKKLFNKLQAVKREIVDTSEEFQVERRELEETQNSLLKELKLKCLILENFVPAEERAKLLQRAVLDEDEDRWRLAERGGPARLGRRPVSAAGYRRPVSEYARLAGSVHGGTRYKGENVMLLELDMPARTTRDYRGPVVAPRYQAALEAALTPQEDEISVNAAPAAAESRFRVRASRSEQPAAGSKPARRRPPSKSTTAAAAAPANHYPQPRGLVPK
ncbi:kinesin-like protein KIF3B [Amphibalanus amphitrite]|uniref:kinesin-like protein KIF3B n=1 Tax=Amphibalanus amphitrite TaxID=1232801 RepID=UPI001C91A370|nr:kinesin-like protein KIF3B [Amphibalanus amphitrite]XP_043233146.1 kinesin-like protein KIF3B [Amphibalanus amphitrite]XP_043233157.1 kinesin-like protein KIF3B [Amphibalanus amphitrite]